MTTNPHPFPTRPASRPRTLLLALLLFLPGGSLAAQSPDVAALDRAIAGMRDAWNVPGLAVAIVKDGRVVLEKGYGVRELGHHDPVDEHTLFAIASNSKAFTAATVAMLVDEGRLGWDDRVRDHLPWFELHDPYAGRDMRIRDLLSHRSGLGTYSGDLVWYGTAYSPAEVVRRMRHLPPAGPFRGGYGYSNVMFIAAGEVVHAVSGVPWAEFVRNRILLPLGMRRTVVSVDSLPGRNNVATPHAVWEGTLRPIDWVDWDGMAAGGGIISSVHEMSEWLKLQLRGGTLPDGDTLFSPAAQWTMWTMHTPIAVTPAYQALYPSTHFRGYGLGWSLHDYLGRRVVSHGGAYDGMYSRVVLVPEEKLGLIVLTNSMTGVSTAIANTIVDAYLGGGVSDWGTVLLQREREADAAENRRRADAVRQTLPNTQPTLPLAAYAGTYSSDLYGSVEVALEHGQLVLRMTPYDRLVAQLNHLQVDTWRIDWRNPWAWFGSGTAQFVLDAAGRVTELKLAVPNQDLWFEELILHRDGG